MTSRRDQIQAHRFLVRRLDTALVSGEPSAAQPPGQRLRTGLVLGVAAGLLGVGGSAVAGMLAPKPSTAWHDGKSLIVEQGTYDRYVLVGGVLHPVLNLASARLLLGASVATVTVAASAVDAVPHGRPLGIPGAPAELPAPAALAAGPWTVCGAGGVVSAALGVAVPGTALTASQALYVVSGTAHYLVWQGERHLLADAPPTMAALQLATGRPVPVPEAWVAAVPAGEDIRPMAPGGKGPGLAVGGVATTLGELYAAHDQAGQSFYTVTARGLTPVTPVQAALLQAGGAPAPRSLAEGALAAAEAAGQVGAPLAGDLPAQVPALVDPGAAVPCLTLAVDAAGAGSGAGSAVHAGLALADPDALTAAGSWTPADATGDRVLVAAGGGALVTVGPDGPGYLVTDAGAKFPIVSQDDAARLGYQGVAPLVVPAAVLAVWPTGPRLAARDALAAQAPEGAAVAATASPGS